MNFKILLLQSIMAMLLLNSCSDEKPTEPNEPVYGYVYIVTQPDSAEIFVNDISTSKFSPDTIKVPVGNQKISIKKSGYRDTTLTVTVVKEEYILRTIQLLPGVTGSIYINSNPANAKIYVNGVNTNKATPNTISGLLPKSYEFTLKKVGYYDVTFFVNIISGETIVRNVDLLVAPPGSIVIGSFPSGAQIYNNGINTGKTTPDTINNLYGVNNFTLKLTEFYDTTFSVEALPGEVVTKNIVLTQEIIPILSFSNIKLFEKASSNYSGLNLASGTLVNSNSSDADIYLDIVDLKSQHLRPGTTLRYTDFYNNIFSVNIEDGIDAPFYSSTSGDWTYSKSGNSITYSFLYTNSLNYVKLIINSKGGGTGPTDPFRWVIVSYKYNQTQRDTRF
ncbi:MAG: PEGA domain-containing protein [Ignavibacteriales bacterium]|nr:MAG: PEGA domain-containing protein [Ignavibacteriales bacterium]